ncbi:nucleoside hydrolase [Cnuibacter physcomitrellae]|uniref:nucleoside hydrolase n=1 Tax=Cnuibacter physcomitrellae TaxID=1619308 RepID=UPI002175BC87|nr:nucleoside hydrolase [Cnuibacter physcomitrellae]MCS5497718.1 nucleoside hydrolase [Cnuibacter physcomitrellae]
MPITSPRTASTAALAVAGLLALSACTAGTPAVDAAPTSATTPAVDPTPSEDAALFILDNDWSPYSGGDAMVLLNAPDAELIGTTTVTGDAWSPQGTASALSLMEAIGVDDVPVAQGQEYPLINTPARSYARAKLYGGGGAWLGAFAPSDEDPTVPAVADPDEVTEPVVGWAQHLAADERDAVDFLIEKVHEFPGRVTIVTTGPLTNIAAAIRRDPTFSTAAKGIVIGGGNVYQLSPGETDAAFNSSEGFNFRFDPESAHIVLTGDWKQITVVGDATSSVMFDDALMDRIVANDSAKSRVIEQIGYVGNPIWDETTAAIAADPTLIAESIPLRMDVDLSEGPSYGQARVWADGDSPGLGEALVTYVQAVDTEGVTDLFVAATR